MKPHYQYHRTVTLPVGLCIPLHVKLRCHSIISSKEVLQSLLLSSSWPFLLPILSALIDVSNLGQVLLELDK